MLVGTQVSQALLLSRCSRGGVLLDKYEHN